MESPPFRESEYPMSRLELEYLKPQSGQKYSFYSLPKLLMDSPVFDSVDTDAKILYCCFLERAAQSAKNPDEYTDDKGRLYIIYTIEEIMERRRCARATAVKWVSQLNEIGLIEKKRRGQGKATIIYVKDFATADFPAPIQTIDEEAPPADEPQPADPEHVTTEPVPETPRDSTDKSRSLHLELLEVQDVNFKKFKPYTSRNSSCELQEVQDVNSIEKDLIEKDLIDPSFPPSLQNKAEETEGGKESTLDFDKLEEQVKEQIDFDVLLQMGYDKSQIMEIVRLIVDTLCRDGPISIGKNTVPGLLVKKRLRELGAEHIASILDKLSEAQNIRNPRAYLLALLCNAPSSFVNSELMGTG